MSKHEFLSPMYQTMNETIQECENLYFFSIHMGFDVTNTVQSFSMLHRLNLDNGLSFVRHSIRRGGFHTSGNTVARCSTSHETPQ